MADYTKYTKQEMQAYAIAKSIKEIRSLSLAQAFRSLALLLQSVRYAPAAIPS